MRRRLVTLPGLARPKRSAQAPDPTHPWQDWSIRWDGCPVNRRAEGRDELIVPKGEGWEVSRRVGWPRGRIWGCVGLVRSVSRVGQ